MGYEVDVLVDGKVDIGDILAGECRKVNVYARYVDTLARTKFAVVLHLCYHCRAIDADNLHVEGTIVKQDMIAHLNVLGKVDIRHIYDVVLTVNVGTSKYLDHVSRLILNRFFARGSADLRSFGVDKDANMV